MAGDVWELHDGKKQSGPHSEERVIEAIGRGMDPKTLVRRVGSLEWAGLRNHPAFAMALEQAAGASRPPPGTAPAPMGSPAPAPVVGPGVSRGSPHAHLLVPVGGGVALVAAVIVWALVVRTSSAPAPHASPPAGTSPPAASEPTDPTKEFVELLATMRTLPEALAVTKPLMSDGYNEVSAGAKFLAVWSAPNLTWASAQPPADETSIALVMKDSDTQRGKRLCAPGTIVQIEVTKTSVGPLTEGLLLTEAGNIIAFLGVRSSGNLVAQSVARFCGVVTGKYDYPNSMGGTGHAVHMVGMFDLPENRAR